MKEERMKVLEMLENGKISADEASCLLEALGSKRKRHIEFDEGMADFTQNVSDFAKEFSEKVVEAYRTVQPKVKKVTKKVVSKTADAADSISKSLKNLSNDSDCCEGSDNNGNGVYDETEKKEN